MITKREKNKIKKILGKEYSKQIILYLNKINLRNKYGLPYSSNSTVINVMNGQPHKEIEKAIFELVAIRKEELYQEAEERKRILELKKV